MSLKRRRDYQYQPIPGARFRGATSLRIIAERGYYEVFVGGLSLGVKRTHTHAKALLLVEAKARCLRRMAEAGREIVHYREELSKLRAKGLIRGHRP